MNGQKTGTPHSWRVQIERTIAQGFGAHNQVAKDYMATRRYVGYLGWVAIVQDIALIGLLLLVLSSVGCGDVTLPTGPTMPAPPLPQLGDPPTGVDVQTSGDLCQAWHRGEIALYDRRCWSQGLVARVASVTARRGPQGPGSAGTLSGT